MTLEAPEIQALACGKLLLITGMLPWQLSKSWFRHKKESKGQVFSICKTHTHIYMNLDVTWTFRTTKTKEGVEHVSKHI